MEVGQLNYYAYNTNVNLSPNSILEELKKHRPNANVELVLKAFDFSKKAHLGQTRKSGEPYFAHPIEVARILASHRMDEETVITGLLHDTVEDTLTTIDFIEKEFGTGVSELVDGVTKLSKVSFQSKDVQQSESFRKMLLAMAKDIRVIIVKLADRLHNMRTLEHMASEKRQRIAQETLDIYAPLAHRLGMSWMKTELEDLAFKFLRPAAFDKLQEQIKHSKVQHDQFIARVISIIADRMKTENISCEVTGRRKHFYSIFRKMESRNLEYEQIYDVLAFRIIVESISKCYEALGHVHSMWKPIPGRFKDFIALPKANLYQSLHTTVIGPQGERIEIQIRTAKMHQIAEEGIAAHWTYKTSGGPGKKELEQFAWLRQMVEWQKDMPDAHEFIETIKIDLFADEVYVFTPKGDVLDFPRGSTPIDFAYRVHSEVGNRCKGAKVNGRMVSLKYKLQNGDAVEIITDKNAQPTKDWMKIAVTSRAKSKIRAFVKKSERDAGQALGEEILSRELRKYHERLQDIVSTPHFKTTIQGLNFANSDELFLAIGYGRLSPQALLEKLQIGKPFASQKSIGSRIKNTIASKLYSRKGSPIRVGGDSDILFRFGKCCSPVPGDPIIGYITLGRGVTVHKNDCHKILEIDEKRKIDVEWSKEVQGARIVRIRVVSSDIPGILASVSRIISKNGGNITHASIRTTQDQKAISTFDVTISNTQQLYELTHSIEKIKGIISVERVKSL
ncbi:MAG: bifunctional (p)ppGpp synthetase/guanosine-3',5'-bis(diphosphate) 3'-pyrophosphohydrolase [Bdellovibrionales bacterium]|nr:bifunctional (p)ppGpp synthetase/guanosine-3',5'-bis(diphosphate) 3'-pyrophosphohydrolase [Bdellovibrionales bacterium]